MFRDEEAAKQWLADCLWPDGKPTCPRCNSHNVQSDIQHKTMLCRCRQCTSKSMFSIQTGTVMEGSHLKHRIRAVAIRLFRTSLKGVASLKLHRELGISQKAAWFLLQRLRQACATPAERFAGPVEVDETCLGGERKHMPERKRAEPSGRGGAGKTAVAGVKDRGAKRVSAAVVEATDQQTLRACVAARTVPGATVHSAAAGACAGLPGQHAAVQHGAGESVPGPASSHGLESFWALLKRGCSGTCHRLSPKPLNRSVQEFVGHHNVREQDTLEQLRGGLAARAVQELSCQRLRAGVAGPPQPLAAAGGRPPTVSSQLCGGRSHPAAPAGRGTEAGAARLAAWAGRQPRPALASLLPAHAKATESLPRVFRWPAARQVPGVTIRYNSHRKGLAYAGVQFRPEHRPVIRPEQAGLPRPGAFSKGCEVRGAGIPFLGDHLRLRLKLCGKPRLHRQPAKPGGPGGSARR